MAARMQGKGARRVSQADVAGRAGVSGQTVSRVANGMDNVEPATRERVLDAMRELGYRPNKAARALRSGHFGTIGVTAFNLRTHGNVRTLSAIVDAAGEQGYSVTLVPVARPTRSAILHAFDELLDQAVDGVIPMIEIPLSDSTDLTIPPGLPVVVVSSGAATGAFPFVDNDQKGGSRALMDHLIGLGHREIRFLGGPVDSYPGRQREEVWRESLAGAGLEMPPVMRGDWTPEDGYIAGREVSRESGVTAVVVANDQMALGVLRALHEAGLRVPEDVSVVGFDDIGEAASFWPPLTTVHQNFEDVGRRAVAMLLDEIRGKGTGDAAGPVVIPTSLVVRGSTGPARPS
ncbi:LacI family DNA-binding transcriptional regulator [Acidipropionibacterium virtanenii]|uniref:Lactose operon repressor n=1 Tax=Acidipropionibacterium virtanenii TaxID=2057246 RepID=A0A344UXA6_9ACTN|nr:LacI family DNA-binding transcriptional regulator [Acidipropionibacterium virtanenii]AXE39904.1 Lactose operon repressor [Acidipropionibacterium virtanenii]